MLVKKVTQLPRLFNNFNNYFMSNAFNYLDVSDDFDEFFRFPTSNYSTIKSPIHDIIENEKEFIVEAMMAGIKKDDISIDVNKDVLTIKAERKEIRDLKYNHKESFTGKYQRSFVLPDLADVENISASLIDGVLTVSIPKLKNETKLSKKIIEIK